MQTSLTFTQALAHSVNGLSLVSFLFLQTKLKFSSFSLLVVAVGSYQKAAGSSTKNLHLTLLAAKLGRKRASSALLKQTLVTLRIAVLPHNSPITHQKQVISSSNVSSRRRKQNGQKCTREVDSGWDTHRRFRLWLLDQSCWRR